MPSGSEHSVPSASLSSVAEPAPATAPSTPNAADAHASDAVMRAMSQMPAMLAYWDKDLRCRYANEAYLGWFGRTAAEMQGIGMRELLGPLYELNRPYIEGALTGVPQEFERRIPLPAGGFRDSLATYTPDIIDGQVPGTQAAQE